MSVPPNRAHSTKSLIVLPHPSTTTYRLHTWQIHGPPKGLRERGGRDTVCGRRGRSGKKGRRGDMYQMSTTIPPCASSTSNPPPSNSVPPPKETPLLVYRQPQANIEPIVSCAA
jgi:hypothetical protein